MTVGAKVLIIACVAPHFVALMRTRPLLTKDLVGKMMGVLGLGLNG